MDKHTRCSKHLDSTLFFFQTIRPLATSTPYDIQSPDCSRQQRQFFTPPICCSTPKQTRVKRKLPVVISQRRLQFTDNKRMTIKNIKIWLL